MKSQLQPVRREGRKRPEVKKEGALELRKNVQVKKKRRKNGIE